MSTPSRPTSGSDPDLASTRAPDAPSILANVPCVLLIRDGWGRHPDSAQDASNAIVQARTPVADALEAAWPTTLVRTSGEDVGLPGNGADAVMGNSEVGHQNLGAGRVVDQELMRITNAIRGGSFFENDALRDTVAHAERTGGLLHLLGLASDGCVHSDLEHAEAILEFIARSGFDGSRVVVHAITDGRDTARNGGIAYLGRLTAAMKRTGVGRLGSVIGRFFAMDRDLRWKRVREAYECLVHGSGAIGTDARSILEHAYANPPSETRHGDEFVAPTWIPLEDLPRRGRIGDGDAVVFFNFRGDRPRELTRAFVLADDAWRDVKGGGFDRGARLDDLFFTSMANYESGLPVSAVVFERPPKMDGILGAVLADAGVPQFRCAETEKFAHVTFFFNDYREEPFAGERRTIVPSPRDVPTYDLKPEMSARGVCDAVLATVRSDDGEPVIIVNFANPDMVGHTGSLEATIAACETVDACVGEIVDAVLERGGSLIVTADHGNAEEMRVEGSGRPQTAHTNFPVPLTIVGEEFRDASLRDGGRLGDVAPTLLDMIGLAQPAAMTGRSLIERT